MSQLGSVFAAFGSHRKEACALARVVLYDGDGAALHDYTDPLELMQRLAREPKQKRAQVRSDLRRGISVRRGCD